ncbi:MAG: alpha/beta hydrolase [Bacillota bacterium]|nr:alpha/beta hydrolase [Bacillota bacterium]
MAVNKDSLTNICYEVVGKEDGSDTLLFIHGAGGNMGALKALAYQFPEYKCVLVDLPGHNLSGGNIPNNVSGYTSAIENFIISNKESFGDNITCIGHSMGGCISLELALRKISGIERLVILNSGAKIDIDKEIINKAKESKIDKLWMYKAGGSHLSPRVYSFFLKGFREMIASQKIAADDLLLVDKFDVRDSVKDIKLPVLIITGAKEILARPEDSKYLHSQIDGSQLIIMERVAHLMPIVIPEKLALKIRPFLAVRTSVM